MMFHGPELEPLIGLYVQSVVLVAKGPGGKTFLQSLRLCCGTVLICTTDVECPPIAGACTATSALVHDLWHATHGYTYHSQAHEDNEHRYKSSWNVPRVDISTQGASNDVPCDGLRTSSSAC